MRERIIQFLKAENKSSAQLAEEIGVQPSGISHILSGRNKPSLEFVTRMLEKYKFLSTEWLLFGKGTMYREEGTQKLFDDSQLVVGNIHSESHNDEKNHINNQYDSILVKSDDDDDYKPKVDRIVWFFSDGSFKEYTPGR